MKKKENLNRSQMMGAKAIKSHKQLNDLPSGERVARDRALNALSQMRWKNLSLTQAAKQAETTPGNVRKYAEIALYKDKAGRVYPKATDRMPRQMTILTPEGLQSVNVGSSLEASKVGEYMNAVKHFLNTGDTTRLRKFQGKSIAGRPLLTDPQTIENLAFRHELEFEDIYQSIDE